jgi:hypothetical protein
MKVGCCVVLLLEDAVDEGDADGAVEPDDS